MSLSVRALAARSCFDVVDQGMSLSEVLPKAQALLDNPLDKALLQEICFGVMRYLPQLEAVCSQLMAKPLIKQLRPLQFLLYVGIYQLKFMRIPDHAAISETVEAARELKGQSLTKLINGVLRNVQRQQELFNFEAAPAAVKFNHPGWLITALQQAYPEQWQAILDANQQKAPLWLRVNVSKISATDYAAALTRAGIEYSRPLADLPAAIKLAQAQDVTSLPGYSDGWFSVQDAAAQYAATLLDVQNGQQILDACCAPGGKTCHILELAPDARVTALDKDARRLMRVHDNLARLGLTAKVIAADASEPTTWWQGQLFDRILLDVPCSATGVIRRHPDIRWLRKKADIPALAELQQRILQQCWALLAPGGSLLYATCSVLPQENSMQIEQFLQQNSDASLVALPHQPDNANYGWQILPGERDVDGFFYARLVKQVR
ncbi:MAG: 16S rRNA (cytosine(967)-C(5))-methyltransferase [Alteromonadaceae bacterium]|jgi:16S rRNA (cytosine967-C5)-methyltransferase|uniref:16S rRNA (cytosine(967)-C(5))-methyltransferase RsmB n=1 Tax=Rheinheimera aquimaris TaxID=412437 RepID=UPI000C4945E8|nr:16S rRNA (cytosine(967)-C(5))-methyltransferase RsmB [Rheinheimera aquimaris]MBJ92643.1 16S rRNA (cytosine(967)-C(5))-methyltransferase [Alteromonadaceae bacterium]HBN89585.1 16S rRNA (cytosine(967)-C(5))-methyltransferase [Rheinheimera sp.]|tara:strand:+ start:5903 stop:7207 length:1305 start_codon:yes stop_codon:yes gene_type:complete